MLSSLDPSTYTLASLLNIHVTESKQPDNTILLSRLDLIKKENFGTKYGSRIVSQSKRYPIMLFAILILRDNFKAWETISNTEITTIKNAQITSEKSDLTEINPCESDNSKCDGSEKEKYKIKESEIDSPKIDYPKIDSLKINSFKINSHKTEPKTHPINEPKRTKESLHSHIKEIKLKLKNLKALSRIISNLCQNKLSNLQHITDFDHLLSTHFIKNIPINPELLTEELHSHINIISSTLTQNTKPYHKPISKIAIKKQTHLINTVRIGLNSKLGSHYFVPYKKSANDVYALVQRTKPDNRIAFYKESPQNHLSSPIMEKIIWDIAVILGLEELFVPTLIFHTTKDDEHDNNNKIHHFGSLQPRAKGVTFKKYLSISKEIRPKIEKNHFIKAFITSLIFGMFDAHSSNMMINKKGKIHFFDNCRTLPHSNNFIYRCDTNKLSIPFRSALLQHDYCYTPLSKESIEYILNELIVPIQNKIADLYEYMNSLYVQRLLCEMIPQWLNPALSLKLLVERLNKITETLMTTKMMTLEDLVLKVFPQYNFAFMISFIYNHAPFDSLKSIPKNKKKANEITDETEKCNLDDDVVLKLKKEIHQGINTSVGIESLMAEIVLSYKISHKKLQSLCNNPNLTLNDQIRKFIKNFSEDDNSLLYTRIYESETITRDLLKFTFIDFKDWSIYHIKNELTIKEQFIDKNIFVYCFASQITAMKYLNFLGQTFLIAYISDTQSYHYFTKLKDKITSERLETKSFESGLLKIVRD